MKWQRKHLVIQGSWDYIKVFSNQFHITLVTIIKAKTYQLDVINEAFVCLPQADSSIR